jgi:diguanylate cyclase (GGDEF)-like protein
LPLEQALLTMLGVVVLANVLLVALIPLRIRGQRQATPHDQIEPTPHGPAAAVDTRPPSTEPRQPPADLLRRGEPPSAEDSRAAAAIEAFVAEVSPEAAGRPRSPVPSGTISGTGEAAVPFEASPEGLAGPAAWDRTLREESARVARFGRPVTVVMAEIRDLDGVIDRLGRGVADRVVTETARLLVTKGRAADRIAWLGDATFGVLLSETEEVRASGYVDRMRAAADGWLESAGLSVRLSLGWASPAEGVDVMAAAAAAEQRMRDVDRRSASEATPTAARRRSKRPVRVDEGPATSAGGFDRE